MTDVCPKLDSERLVLHPLRAAHADALFPILRDAEIWRYTDSQAPETLRELRDRYVRLESRTSGDGQQLWLNWALETRADSVIVGFVQATVDKATHQAEIAYALAQSAWGQGFASEGVAIMLSFLYRRDVCEIHATVDERNSSSVRLLERLDFRISNSDDRQNLRFSKLLARTSRDIENASLAKER